MINACLFVIGIIILWCVYDRKLIFERRRAVKAEAERDELVTRLFGNEENYQRSKVNERWIPDEREFKVAKECADKGIPRSNKQYPARFRGTR